eukprot:TRINITY_DN17119_c0_g1_i1.p1 TRINITY_DN17119_c0_g1~~TRINITY_DN17119_c0_g1_i1.p1  ORF type:complete len:440 (+),score=54.24 TRINITY_DN17119_c0_g1_i1:71-1390(+)
MVLISMTGDETEVTPCPSPTGSYSSLTLGASNEVDEEELKDGENADEEEIIIKGDLDATTLNCEEFFDTPSLVFKTKEETEDYQEPYNPLDFPEIRGKYKALKKIGEGTFSSVYLAQRLDGSDSTVAIKRIYPTCSPERIYNEIQHLKVLGGLHNVAPFLGGLRERDQVTIVMPFMDHDNFKEYLPHMRVDQMKQYIRCLFQALWHLHQNGIIHRDIKPGNFLYKPSTNQCMLVDFGLAQLESQNFKKEKKRTILNVDRTKRKRAELDPQLQKRMKANNGLRTSQGPSFSLDPSREKQNMMAPRGGTRGFRAPEVLMKVKHQTVAIDIWSAGVILLCLFSTRYPFFLSPDDLHSLTEISAVFGTRELKEKAARLGRKLHLPTDPAEVPKQNLRELCLRLSSRSEEIPLEGFDLLERCLDIDPATRISAEGALNHPFLAL